MFITLHQDPHIDQEFVPRCHSVQALCLSGTVSFCSSQCECMIQIKLFILHWIMIAVLEAEDIDLYLRPLRRLISSLEERSFPKVDTLLPALFHTLCLIWSHSQYYCTPQRMVVLLQEFCNLIIEKVKSCTRVYL